MNLLDLQKLQSEIHNNKVHDEMLFIIIHQSYELWFKQIIHEILSVVEYFEDKNINETSVIQDQSDILSIIKNLD